MKNGIILAILTLTTLLNADYILRYNMDGQETKLFYKDNKTTKFISNSQDGKVEIYNIKNNSYLVNYTEQGITVIDTNKLKNKLSEFGISGNMYQENIQKPQYKIQKTGKKIKVGNIIGKQWILSGTDEDGKFREKVVVSSDKKLVKTLSALFKSYSNMSGGAMGEENPFEIEKGYVLIKADGIQLLSFKHKNVSTNEYKIPKTTNTREAFNKRYKSKAKKNTNSNRNKQVYKDKKSCYNNICCGKIAGESVVLLNSLYTKSKNIFRIVDSATCKKNNKDQRIEEVLWEDDYGKRILLSLNLNDRAEGIVKKAIDNGGAYNGSMLKTDNLLINQTYKAYYGLFSNTNQERMDIRINQNSVLTITRIHDSSWQRSLQGWAEKGWIEFRTLKNKVNDINLDAQIPPKQTRNNLNNNVESVENNNIEEQNNEDDTNPFDSILDSIDTDDINKAADMFKKLF